ncbi:MAG: hypothetical protein JWR10_4897 [Rubritepida sp.]|nr:hypothetical protein [Rubritepida sp.]
MRGQPERILVVIPSPAVGGAEAQTMQVARGLLGLGAEIAVAVDPALIGTLAPVSGGARLLPAPIAFDAGADPAAMQARQKAALAPVLAGYRPDVALVCLPLPQEGLGAMLALQEAGIPMLGMAHLVRSDWELGATDRAAASGLRAGWAAVSAPAARRLEALFGLGYGRVAAVPNGLPPAPPSEPTPRATLGLPNDVPVLLTVGRLDERKGAALAPGIAVRIAPGILTMAGEGPLQKDLVGVPGVHLLGHFRDVPALLAMADAFLLASAHEGCPLSVLEAARAGRPIIATAAALEAWPEAAEMALVVTRDPGSIAAAFADVLADRIGTARRVIRARQVVAAWDEEAMIRRTAWLLAAEAAR